MKNSDFRVDSVGGIATLTLMVALGQMAVGLFVPSLPSLVSYFDTDMGTVQLTLTVHFTAFALFQLLAGPLSDRFGRRPVILTGLAIYACGAIACALAESISALIGARILLAIGACSGHAVSRAVIRDRSEGADSARIMSYIGMAMALSPALTPTIGGQLQGHFGWQACFVLMACISGVLFLYSFFFLPETIRTRNADAMKFGGMLATYGRLMIDRRFFGYAALNGCIFGALFAYQTGSPYLLMVELGYSPQAYGLLILFNVAGFLSGNLITNRFGRRVGIYGMVRAGSILTFVAGIAMVVPTELGHVSALSIIGPSMLLLFAMGITLPSAMAGAMQHFPEVAGAASALLGFLQMGTGALGSFMISSLQNQHPHVMPDVFAVSGVLALVALAFIPKPGAGRD
ncbi:multidrug effflux MFS transporter [Nisaea acidiphila]|uniref:Bcr/CflA family efflux transporter n=1 Tax=Nisaea acidiphila TaxID=1862145 RepID=A0A9J7AYD2_9PROT|nr:multidrug effflux MFS transporter [Nisaea acidiphila]UUX52078.1 multidrug effflux MFS transporter [Nisaea acidiphila]